MNRTSQQTQTQCVWDAFGNFKCGGSSSSSSSSSVGAPTIERFEANGDKTVSSSPGGSKLDAFIPTRAPLFGPQKGGKEGFCGCSGGGGGAKEAKRENFCGCEGPQLA